jgi:hypothetical protein
MGRGRRRPHPAATPPLGHAAPARRVSTATRISRAAR